MACSLSQQIAALQPQLKGPEDALAIGCHCVLLTCGFEAVNEAGNPCRLPLDWNDREPYCFHYRHESSSLTFTVKMLSMGPKLIILGTANEDPKQQVLQMELRLEDHVALPQHELIHAAELENAVQHQFAERLVPRERPTACEWEPPRAPPQRPDMILRDPLRNQHDMYPHGNPFAVGRGDLHPLGGVLGPPGAAGGILIGPNHPGFGIPREPFGPGVPPGNRPPFPGARFDPFGPGGMSGDPDWDHMPHPGSSNMFL
eukprot:GGOE01001422.1.p1 GENE.GGOE01001422.1~~GGOE01001422.1.p1  ORF type:complete len:272 (-),score=53.13 GGOE01001422.1:318-1091(-)